MAISVESGSAINTQEQREIPEGFELLRLEKDGEIIRTVLFPVPKGENGQPKMFFRPSEKISFIERAGGEPKLVSQLDFLIHLGVPEAAAEKFFREQPRESSMTPRKLKDFFLAYLKKRQEAYERQLGRLAGESRQIAEDSEQFGEDKLPQLFPAVKRAEEIHDLLDHTDLIATTKGGHSLAIQLTMTDQKEQPGKFIEIDGINKLVLPEHLELGPLPIVWVRIDARAVQGRLDDGELGAMMERVYEETIAQLKAKQEKFTETSLASPRSEAEIAENKEFYGSYLEELAA